QMMELVDIADSRAPQLRAAAVIEPAGLDPDDLDFPRLWWLEQAAKMQQGRFAGARGRDQRNQLAAFDNHVSGIEHAHHALAFAIMPVDTRKAQMGTIHSAAPLLDHIGRRARPDKAWRGSSNPGPGTRPRQLPPDRSCSAGPRGRTLPAGKAQCQAYWKSRREEFRHWRRRSTPAPVR